MILILQAILLSLAVSVLVAVLIHLIEKRKLEHQKPTTNHTK